MKLRVLRLGSDENGDVGVGVFPQREKILIGTLGGGLQKWSQKFFRSQALLSQVRTPKASQRPSGDGVGELSQ